MRKELSLLLLFSLFSCGGGGGGTEGFYSFSVLPDRYSSEVCVISYTEDNGEIKDVSLPTESIPVTIQFSYSGTGTPMKLFLKKAKFEVDGNSAEVALSGEAADGSKVEIPVPGNLFTSSPFIFANELEDKSFSRSTKVLVANSQWEEEEKSFTYTQPSIIDVGKGIKNVTLTLDDVTCIDDGTGHLTPPCSGTIDYQNGTVEVAIDSSYLQAEHSKTYTYSPLSGVLYLSQNIVPGTVVIESDSITLYDDGSGNIEGDGTGTVDYDRGIVSFSISTTKLSYQESSESKTAPFAPSGNMTLRENLSPSTVSITAYDSTGSQVGFCSDDGQGNLFGDCSGTVDYDTGTVSYVWNASISGTTQVFSYTYRIYNPVSLTATWNTQDKNLSATISYRKLSDTASKVFTFSVPETPDQVNLFVGDTPVDGNISCSNALCTLTLPDYPEDDVYAELIFTQTFNFNPAVLVQDPQPVTAAVKVTVEGELENGEDLSTSFIYTISGKTCQQ